MKLAADFEERLARELAARTRSGQLPRGMLEPLRQVPARELLSLGGAGRGPGGRWHDLRFRIESIDQPSPPGIDWDRLLQEPEAQARIQTVVQAFGRPSLLIQDHTFTPPVSDTWGRLLTTHREALDGAIPAVGRIEVGARWFGTGVLVAPGVVATNRHVAHQFVAHQPAGWTWAPGVGGPGAAARIDFRREHGRSAVEAFELGDVLHLEDEEGPDLAFFSVATAGLTAAPLELAPGAEPDDAVAVVGYTSRVSGMAPEVDEILADIFGTTYDVKRLAPGRVLRSEADRLAHDCSTQGGNSGSALVDIATGALAGIHFEGGLRENYAVPAVELQARLERLP
jgi:endonuclease G